MQLTILAMLLFGLLAVLVLTGIIVLLISAPKAAAIMLGVVAALLLSYLLVGVSVRTQVVYNSPPPMIAEHETIPVPAAPPEAPSAPAPPIADGGPGPGDSADSTNGRTPDRAASGTPLSIRETLYRPDGSTLSREGILEIPAWVPAESTIERSRDLVDLSLSSQRFATTAEAREQLWKSVLRPELIAFLNEHSSGISLDSLTFEDAQKLGIIKREVDVTYPLEVGGFVEQVHQVHWQVQLDRHTRDLVQQTWKPAIVRKRLALLATVLGGMTLLFGAGALVSRRRRHA